MDGGKDQIMLMTNFILHEARNCAQVRTALRARGWQAQEKADEVSAKAEQDYTVEKQRLVEDAKQQIRKEMDRREQNVELETKM